MKTNIKLNDHVWYIGANDRRTHLFENYWPIPKGVAYNTYVVVDEKIAIVDTIEKSFLDDYIENIDDVCQGRTPDYLIVNHMEPDHTGAIRTLLLRFPDITIVGNAKTLGILKNYYGTPRNYHEVKEGDSISLGKLSLNFVMTPMLHWPETMVTYVPEIATLFSGDIFGAFGTLDGGVFDDELDLDYLEEEISRYYSNIVGKYGAPAQAALKKLAGVELKMVCATHGPVWRTHIADIVARYDKWSRYATDKGVVIAFASMYGHTEKMADMIARFLRQEGIEKIRIHDTSTVHPSYIINDIFRYNGVILGCPAYNAEMYTTMKTLLDELSNKCIKNHYLAFFANKTWSGGAMKHFNKFAEEVKWEIVAPAVEATGEPTEADIEQCRAIAKAMAAKLNEA